MIKSLMNLFEVTFPTTLVDAKDYNTVTDSKYKVYFDNTYVFKDSNNLLDALDIHNTFIPDTIAYFSSIEVFLANLDLVKQNYILDSRFNVYLPQKYITVEYHTFSIFKEYDRYFRINEFSYFFEKTIEPSSKKELPFFSIVDNITFFIGWSLEPTHIEIKL